MPSYKTSDFIRAIPNSGGLVSEIARRVGCTWHTAKKWIDKYPSVLSAYNNECEEVNDLAEGVIIQAIRDKDLQTAKWWVGRKRGDEGFAKKHDVTIEYVNDWRNAGD